MTWYLAVVVRGTFVDDSLHEERLADRALSQLLRGDWPKTLEELEERKKDASVPVSKA